jgi:hypothetical protein
MPRIVSDFGWRRNQLFPLCARRNVEWVRHLGAGRVFFTLGLFMVNNWGDWPRLTVGAVGG